MEPLDSELASVLATQRELDLVPDELQKRVLNTVLGTVGAVAPSQTPVSEGALSSSSSIAVDAKVGLVSKGWLSVVGLLGVLVGNFVGVQLERYVLSHEHRPNSMRISKVAHNSDAVPESVSIATPPVVDGHQRSSDTAVETSSASLELPSRRVPVNTAVLPEETPTSEVDTGEFERRVLSEAQRYLRARLGHEALRVLSEYDRRFPDGHFREERDAIEVRALDSVQSHELAREKARDFLERYPRSLFATAVRRIAESQ